MLVSSNSRRSCSLKARFSQLLYFDIKKRAPQPSEEQLAAHQVCLQMVQKCQINSIFSESKFVQADSLSQLVQAHISAAGRSEKRLLPYKENLTDELLNSLQLVLKPDARVANAYFEHITQEVMRLVKANAMQIDLMRAGLQSPPFFLSLLGILKHLKWPSGPSGI
ncbi:hypothetical protein POM88_038833 [Heracleum sosnowskyi]|uniref:Uncharacterized protein n=1 Tax=Heracleum sosnowskyi TaxID=360622 RepID=A0AAD8M8D0_9APIA|nr:hypothetical protein POM88_038833 [Heracleum sosnowskyi]